MTKIVDESILFFSRFLSQNSLWKLSTFCGYKGIYSSVCEECEKSVFIQTRHSSDSVSRVEWVTSLNRELIAWLDCTFCPVVLQLSWPFSSLHASHVCHFGLVSHESVARSSCETPLIAHILSFLHTPSHTTFT